MTCMLTLTFGTTRKAKLSALGTGALYPQQNTFVFIWVRGFVASKATECEKVARLKTNRQSNPGPPVLWHTAPPRAPSKSIFREELNNSHLDPQCYGKCRCRQKIFRKHFQIDTRERIKIVRNHKKTSMFHKCICTVGRELPF